MKSKIAKENRHFKNNFSPGTMYFQYSNKYWALGEKFFRFIRANICERFLRANILLLSATVR